MSDPSWWFDRRRGGGGGKSSTLPAEVYRARDTKLDREVAIKVLPEEFARDGERLARFEREAKLLASLNHPNVATLNGLEEHDGRKFLVMELVEGETLADRIARGPIPIDEAISLFIEIAEGLMAAHEKGIIHRDLKPANIKITPEGRAKILDFGLARLAEADTDPSGEGGSQSPTLTKGTALGAIMGTASYMSPEQARGKTVDKRTDVWAYGCCLYEALTAHKAFEGETITDILAAVVHQEPILERVSSQVPADVNRVLRRCFKKDRRQRFYDIADVRLDLEDAQAAPFATTSHLRARTPLVAMALATVAALGVALWSLTRSGPVPLKPATSRVAPRRRVFAGRDVARHRLPKGAPRCRRLTQSLLGKRYPFRPGSTARKSAFPHVPGQAREDC